MAADYEPCRQCGKPRPAGLLGPCRHCGNGSGASQDTYKPTGGVCPKCTSDGSTVPHYNMGDQMICAMCSTAW